MNFLKKSGLILLLFFNFTFVIIAQNNTKGNFDILFGFNSYVAKNNKNLPKTLKQIYVSSDSYLCLGHKNGGIVEFYGNGSKYLLEELETKLRQLQRKKKTENVSLVIGKQYDNPEFYFRYIEKTKSRNRCPDPPITIALPEQCEIVDFKLQIRWTETENRFTNQKTDNYWVYVMDLYEEVLFKTKTKNKSAILDLTHCQDEDGLLVIRVTNGHGSDCSANAVKIANAKLMFDYQNFKSNLDLTKLSDRIKEIVFLDEQKCSANVLDRWYTLIEEYPESLSFKIAGTRCLMKSEIIDLQRHTSDLFAK